MRRTVKYALLFVGLLQSCVGYKRASVLDSELPNGGATQFVKFDSVVGVFKPAVAQLGSFIPTINVVNYKKTPSKVSLHCYVSYRRFVGVPDTTENFEIREYFYNNGYAVYLCDERIENGKVRFIPRKILAEDRSNFILVCNRKRKEFLVLFLKDLSIGRIYNTDNVYMKFE